MKKPATYQAQTGLGRITPPQPPRVYPSPPYDSHCVWSLFGYTGYPGFAPDDVQAWVYSLPLTVNGGFYKALIDDAYWLAYVPGYASDPGLPPPPPGPRLLYTCTSRGGRPPPQ